MFLFSFIFIRVDFPGPLERPLLLTPPSPSNQRGLWGPPSCFPLSRVVHMLFFCGPELSYPPIIFGSFCTHSPTVFHISCFLFVFFFIFFFVNYCRGYFEGPTCCVPTIFFLFTGFVSLSAVSLAENPFLIFCLCFSLLAVVTPRPPVPRGFHPAV